MQAKKPKNIELIENPQTIDEHLRNVRIERGLLQKDVAQLIEVGVSSIEHWEGNISQPQLKFLPPIIKFLKYIPQCCSKIPQLKSEVFLKRVKLGISQKEMAKRIGIDPSTLGQGENKKRPQIVRTTDKIIIINLDSGGS